MAPLVEHAFSDTNIHSQLHGAHRTTTRSTNDDDDEGDDGEDAARMHTPRASGIAHYAFRVLPHSGLGLCVLKQKTTHIRDNYSTLRIRHVECTVNPFWSEII